jgi:hypothetical protein
LDIEPNELIGELQYCLIDISLPLPKPMPIQQNFFHKINVLPQFVNKSVTVPEVPLVLRPDFSNQQIN